MRIGDRKNQASAAVTPSSNKPRSKFNLTTPIKDTYEFDYLNPVWCSEVLPGDTFNVTLRSFTRLATQIVPIMDNMYVDFFFFYVPNRLVYNKWEQLQGATKPDPDSSTSFICPQMTFPAGGPEVGTIFDKFNIVTDVAGSFVIQNTMPLRCYNIIWNEWFRDQNLQDSIIQNIDEGPDAPADYVLMKRGKRHDYFTSALPWPQKGPAVTMPLGSSAPVNSSPTGWGKILSGVANANTPETPLFQNAAGGSGGTNQYLRFTNGTSATTWAGTPLLTGDSQWQDPKLVLTGFEANQLGLTADLSDATAATINMLRQAFALQSIYELDALGGTRFTEILFSRWGVISPDARLQRPEYLGGGSTMINTHPVAQTSETTTESPQGNLSSFGTASTTDRDRIGFTKSFQEHGHVLCLMAARADISYQQGLDRMWSRSTRFDFFEPKLADLGEQAVYNKEIYLQGGDGIADNQVFGYQERFAEYRYGRAQIRGQFRSTYATSLDVWHLAQEFGALPVLNDSFIQQSTPIERAISVPSEPDLLFDASMQITCARVMPAYGVPAFLGRF